MGDTLLDSGTVCFQAEGRLLQELGARLVASPAVALVELIKNAYDADSPLCDVRIEEGGKLLSIVDNGHGMTLDEFKDKWMRIATSDKVDAKVSRIYRRKFTGAKGIGRFAVRYLGDHLTLVTVADDPGRSHKTKLTAKFDWPEIDRLSDIRESRIDYTLERVAADSQTGTTLEVRSLKTSTNFASASSLRAEVLRIVTPLQGLEAGRFKPTHQGSESDPGFRVTLPGTEEKESAAIDLAKMVLSNCWARLQINLSGNRLSFRVSFSSSREPRILEVKVSRHISSGFLADIRYFPRRKGIFQDKGVNGKVAWKWVRANQGVAVVDHGFRIVPYGYEFDDWLHLDLDKAHSRREWRSVIARQHFPIPQALQNRPRDNPALNLPYNFQLVGAVFVESKPPSGATSASDLIPSMDREGFLNNPAFEQLEESVRAGIEFLALEDKRELDRILTKEAREATQRTREEVRRAIEQIKQSPTLTPKDKALITKSYVRLAERLEEVEEYDAQARRSLSNMSLLGVVAGFMTHETKSIVFEMEKAIEMVTSLAMKHPGLKKVAAELNRRLGNFKEQLRYAQMFLEGVRRNKLAHMSAAGQIRHMLNRFAGFAADHGIEVIWAAAPEVVTPPLAPAVYSGVLLNLYTNALKAVLAVASSITSPKVAIRAWNENGTHYLEVSDNGIGVPPELRKRIWDPLYTTTSDTGNPLGSGMGLGLTLVKQVVEDTGGKIVLMDEAPPDFSTCFRVTFPLE